MRLRILAALSTVSLIALGAERAEARTAADLQASVSPSVEAVTRHFGGLTGLPAEVVQAPAALAARLPAELAKLGESPDIRITRYRNGHVTATATATATRPTAEVWQVRFTVEGDGGDASRPRVSLELYGANYEPLERNEIDAYATGSFGRRAPGTDAATVRIQRQVRAGQRMNGSFARFTASDRMGDWLVDEQGKSNVAPVAPSRSGAWLSTPLGFNKKPRLLRGGKIFRLPAALGRRVPDVLPATVKPTAATPGYLVALKAAAHPTKAPTATTSRKASSRKPAGRGAAHR